MVMSMLISKWLAINEYVCLKWSITTKKYFMHQIYVYFVVIVVESTHYETKNA